MHKQERKRCRAEREVVGSGEAGDHAGLADSALPAGVVARRQAVRHCIHCAAERPLRWGRTRRGLQRWRCRGCLRTFCAATGTPLERLHALDAFAGVLDDMLGPGPRSCRELAAAFDVGRMTVWRWRQLICRAFERGQGMPLAAVIEEGVLVVRESRKASREWVDHARDPQRFPAPDRRRWIDYRLLELPLPDPMDPYRIGIQVATAPVGSCIARILGQGTMSENAAGSSTRANADHRRRAKPSGLGHPSNPQLGGPLVDRLALFLEPFRGPATKYLSGYVAWFAARHNGSGRSETRPAWPCLESFEDWRTQVVGNV